MHLVQGVQYGAGHQPVVCMVGNKRNLKPAHKAVKHMGRAALKGGVGGAVVAHAVNNVVALSVAGDHFRYGGYVVLQVGIKADNAVHTPVAGRDHASPYGILVACVGGKAHSPAIGVSGVPLFQQFPSAVTAAVVDVQGVTVGVYTALTFKVMEQGRQGIKGTGQGFLFIIAGNNQCQQGGRTGQYASSVGSVRRGA